MGATCSTSKTTKLTPHANHSSTNKLQMHESKVFMICCMDFRFVEDHKAAMNNLGYKTDYDQYVIAGASLGFTCQDYEQWGKSAMDHLRIGIALHHPIEVLFFDHKDCGFYKKIFPGVTEEEMMKHHSESMQKAHDIMKQNFKTLKFEGFIMNLDGTYDKIIVNKDTAVYKETELNRETTLLHN